MNWNEFCFTHQLKLNKQQEEAVRTTEGPVLLLAVPGSGKTTVLVTRLAYMKECRGIDPKSVLTLTYTVAATKDMASRYQKLFGDPLCENPFEFRTINGVCAKIIRYYEIRQRRNAFTLVTDEKILTTYISQVYREILKVFPTESDIKDIRTKITYTKNMMLSSEEILKLDEQNLPFSEIYASYQKILQMNHEMDYDDQMVYAGVILRKYPEILDYFQNMYRYICVDEAQDTSKIQHVIIEMLAKKSGNLFMVGDEDQSIYAFRAAYPEALLSFEANHENAKVLLMEMNYRSNANIVSAADRFIQNNKRRHEKHMHAVRDAKSKIEVVSLKERKDQYDLILHIAQENLHETAILYRENESVLPIIDLLERQNIPYKMRSHDGVFFTNRVVLDIKNVLKFAQEPRNSDLFLQIYFKLSTYLKKEDALKACRISEDQEIDILEAAIDYLNLPPYTVRKCKTIKTNLEHMKNTSPEKAIFRIVQFMGYKEYLQKMKLKESKIEILLSLAQNEKTISGFLQRMDDLATIVSNSENSVQSKLVLSTIHSSKGLEYDHVLMLDVIDGIFPENAIWDEEIVDEEELMEFEEERRLFYVGITRAKNRLTLLNTESESIFYSELLHLKTTKERKFKDKRIKICKDTEEIKEIAKEFSKGKRINHKIFGNGVIVRSTAITVEVRFDSGEVKKMDIPTLIKCGIAKVL